MLKKCLVSNIITVSFLLLPIFISAQIRPTANIEHCTPFGIDTLGSITLAVTGGTAPYTYSWTPGNYTTSAITDVVKNNYKVKITDNASNNTTWNFKLGYVVKWGPKKNLNQSYDTLKGIGSGMDGIAISHNTLLPDSNGWVQYVITSDIIMFGFVDDSIVPPTYSPVSYVEDLDYGIQIYSNGLYYWSNSVGDFSYVGSCQQGDVISMERSNDTLRFKRNGTTVVTQTLSSQFMQKNLKVKSWTWTGKYFANLGCSFKGVSDVYFKDWVATKKVITHVTGTNINDGTISLEPKTYGDIHTYTWSPDGETTNIISEKYPYTYTVVIADTLNVTSDYKYNVSYKSYWTDGADLMHRNDSILLKPSPSTTWPIIMSKNILPANTDGSVEYMIKSNSTDVLGVYNGTLVPNVYGFLYAINPYLGTLYFYSPTLGYYISGGKYQDGDVVRIERVGSNVHYKINDKTVGTYSVSSGNLAVDWYFGGSIYAYATVPYMANIGVSDPYYYTSPNVYALLQRNLDAKYYKTENNKLYFKYDADYASDTLRYRVYDKTNTVVSSYLSNNISNSITTVSGDNRYYLNTSSLASGYYVLEIINEKKEKYYLRFKKT